MSVVRDPEMGKDYNCKETDLVAEFPPSVEGFSLGDYMNAYDSTTKEVYKVFKLINLGDGPLWVIL